MTEVLEERRQVGTVTVCYNSKTIHTAPVYEGESPYGAAVSDRIRRWAREQIPTHLSWLPSCTKRFRPIMEVEEGSML
jgi:hypothetical protein